MNWKRIRPGLYRYDNWEVGKLEPSGEWFAEGPGVDGVCPTKREAHDLCQRAWEDGYE